MKYYQQILAGLALVAVCVYLLIIGTNAILEGQRSIPFMGPHWKNEGRTLESHEVFNSRYLRVESHSIRTSKGEVINGWMWVDFQDQVNVFVQTADGQVAVIWQIKYGVSKPTLSVVSGAIALNEQPLEAAARELLDELGMVSNNWRFLGKYRQDVSRGGGHVYSFLARNASPKPGHVPSNSELEKQEVRFMSLSEVTNAVLKGDFADAKWSNTAALALLALHTPSAKPLPMDEVSTPLNQATP